MSVVVLAFRICDGTIARMLKFVVVYYSYVEFVVVSLLICLT